MRIIHRTARPDLGATLCSCVTEGFLKNRFYICLLNFDVTHVGAVPGPSRRRIVCSKINYVFFSFCLLRENVVSISVVTSPLLLRRAQLNGPCGPLGESRSPYRAEGFPIRGP